MLGQNMPVNPGSVKVYIPPDPVQRAVIPFPVEAKPDSFERQQAFRIFTTPNRELQNQTGFKKIAHAVEPKPNDSRHDFCLEPHMVVMRATRHLFLFGAFEQLGKLSKMEATQFRAFKMNVAELFGVDDARLFETAKEYQAIYLSKRPYPRAG